MPASVTAAISKGLAPGAAVAVPNPTLSPVGDANLKDALLSEIRRSKSVFYNTVVAQAQKIEVTPERVLFTFSAGQRTLREMFEQNCSWLENIARQLAGRRMAVSAQTDAAVAAAPPTAEAQAGADRKNALKEQALADAGVQAMLSVFPAEIRDVEEM